MFWSIVIIFFLSKEAIGLDVPAPDHDHDPLAFPGTIAPPLPSTTDDPFPDCLSGPTSSTCSYEGSCIMEGDNIVDIAQDILEEDWCRELCYQNFNCNYYTWFDMTTAITKNACYLFSTCQDMDFTCQGCFTGPPACCDDLQEQEHGEWFCPPTVGSAVCHLECFPGYVSDNTTIITCTDGQWSASPMCIKAIGLITGSGDSPGINTVEVYGEGVHQYLPNLPDNRRYHTIQIVDTNVLLCGGDYTGYTETSCLILTKEKQWIPHSITTSSRYTHSSVSMLGQLHLLGGDGSASTTEYLDPSLTNEWSQGFDLLEKTSSACAGKIGPEVFIMTGGYSHSGNVVEYNVTTGLATRLMDLIVPRWHHGCSYVHDAKTSFRGVIVGGGYAGVEPLNDGEIYDLENGEWTKTGQLTTSRYGVRLVILGEDILAFGGYINGPNNGVYLSTVDKFNLTTRNWSPTEEMLEARNHHAVIGVPPSLLGLDQH